ncbi:MAG: hypothetical protein ACRDNH_12210 [Gaiellaceae bacterium]
MAKKDPDRDETEPMEAVVLSAREAMTLISQSTGDDLPPDPSSGSSDAQPAEESATSDDVDGSQP